VIYFHCRV